jgi:hypothetical protein
MSGYIRLSHVRVGLARLCHVRTDYARLGCLGQVRPVYVSFVQVRSCIFWLSQVRCGYVLLGQVKYD